MRRTALFTVCLTLTLGTAEASAPPAAPGATSTNAAGSSSADAGAPQDRAPASWEGATPLDLSRPHETCKAVRLGEWARITCSLPGFIMGVRLHGGSHEGVAFKEAKAEGGVHVIFPMREGDRREIGIAHRIGSGYTVEEDLAVVISELWLPGDTAPVIAIAVPPP